MRLCNSLRFVLCAYRSPLFDPSTHQPSEHQRHGGGNFHQNKQRAKQNHQQTITHAHVKRIICSYPLLLYINPSFIIIYYFHLYGFLLVFNICEFIIFNIRKINIYYMRFYKLYIIAI